MKIGFFGNTNNYPFMLARAFRRLGHEVKFIVNRAERLHRPEFRYEEIQVPYPDWILDIPLLEPSDFLKSRLRNRVVDLLNTCDLVILNDIGISLGTAISRKRMAMCTGSDLEQYCLRETAVNASKSIGGVLSFISRRISHDIWSRLISAQRESIRTSDLVFYFQRGLNPHGDRILQELGVDDDRRIFFLQADVESIRPVKLPNNECVRLFCATRFVWKGPIAAGFSVTDYKGSDVMIKGIAEFWKCQHVPLDIHFVRKGQHWREAEQLAQQEGIAHLIHWHDELTQKEVWEHYRLADICFDQLADCFVAMSGLEAMATGRPVIANGRPEIFEPLIGEPSPICQAKTPSEVCSQMERLVFNREERERVGRESRAHVEKHYSPIAAATRILARLANNT